LQNLKVVYYFGDLNVDGWRQARTQGRELPPVTPKLKLKKVDYDNVKRFTFQPKSATKID